MTTSILFRWWRSEGVEDARSRGKRVSKRRSKTSLTPGIFILCIYIYIPRPRWCREQDYLERPWELILSLSYATPLAFSSSFKTPLDVFLYSLCLFPAFFRITILKILDKPGASAVTFPSPHGENRHAFAPSILSRESQRYNRDFRSNNAVKHLRSFDIYIYPPSIHLQVSR